MKRNEYAGGLRAGDTVRYLRSKRKYNPHIDIPHGSVGLVVEKPNKDLSTWPDDAVQVRFAIGETIGEGAIDRDLLVPVMEV
mgnify:CR=1 FL=1